MPSDRKSILLVVGRAVLQAGLEERLALAAVGGGGAEQVGEVEVELGQHQYDDQRGAGHQQHGLDDLHPGGALHAADRDVEDHQRADREDRDVLRGVAADVEQQRDQRAGADHLGEQVEDRDDDGRGGGRRTDRALAHPEGELVGHRVAAGVAQHLGDQQQRHQPGDEEADRVEEAVVPAEGDGAGDAEERRRRHVVAADGEAVLDAGEAASAGVEVRRAGGLPAGPEGDADRDRDDREEEGGGEELVAIHVSASPRARRCTARRAGAPAGRAGWSSSGCRPRRAGTWSRTGAVRRPGRR